MAVLPVLTPATGLGRVYSERYATLSGQSEAEYLERFGGVLSAERVGKAICDLAIDDSYAASAFRLSAGGLQPAG